jgi:hypothetical protein
LSSNGWKWKRISFRWSRWEIQSSSNGWLENGLLSDGWDEIWLLSDVTK